MTTLLPSTYIWHSNIPAILTANVKKITKGKTKCQATQRVEDAYHFVLLI